MAAGAVDVEATPPGEGRGRRLALLLVAVALVIVGVLATLYLTRGGQNQAAAKLPALQPLHPGPGLLQGTVVQTSGSTLTLATAGGTQTVTIGPSTRIEALLPAAPNTIAPGDFLTVGGIPNQVNSFAIKLVVVIPAAEAAPRSGPPARSIGGFTGWEAFTDAKQEPEVSGTVVGVQGSTVQLMASTGPVTVRLDAQTNLRRLTLGGLDLLQGGDRVASFGSPPSAIMVFPGQ